MSVRVAEALIVVVPTEPVRGVLTAVRWVAGFDEVVVGAGRSIVDDPVGAVLGRVDVLCWVGFDVRAEPHPARAPTTRTAAVLSWIQRFISRLPTHFDRSIVSDAISTRGAISAKSKRQAPKSKSAGSAWKIRTVAVVGILLWLSDIH